MYKVLGLLALLGLVGAVEMRLNLEAVVPWEDMEIETVREAQKTLSPVKDFIVEEKRATSVPMNLRVDLVQKQKTNAQPMNLRVDLVQKQQNAVKAQPMNLRVDLVQKAEQNKPQPMNLRVDLVQKQQTAVPMNLRVDLVQKQQTAVPMNLRVDLVKNQPVEESVDPRAAVEQVMKEVLGDFLGEAEEWAGKKLVQVGQKVRLEIEEIQRQQQQRSAACPHDAHYQQNGNVARCMFVNNTLGVQIPQGARPYCEYYSEGYFGYLWDKKNHGPAPCHPSADSSDSEDTLFCVVTHGEHNVVLPKNSRPVCQDLAATGAFGYEWDLHMPQQVELFQERAREIQMEEAREREMLEMERARETQQQPSLLEEVLEPLKEGWVLVEENV